MGYDAEGILPPFLPHIRNDDGIWAYMVRAAYPDSAICHLPFAISHGPNSHPPLPSEYSRLPVITANGLIHMLIAFCTTRVQADSAEEYIKMLGKELTAIASLSKKEWRELTKELFVLLQHSHLLQLEQKLAEFWNMPFYWVDDLRLHINNIKQSLPTCTPWLPLEFQQFGDNTETFFLEYLRRSGELFQAWPEIWQCALETQRR
jgi:hypothetical protein